MVIFSEEIEREEQEEVRDTPQIIPKSSTPPSVQPEANATDNIGVHTLASRLQPGAVVDSLDSAYALYCEYARVMGFSVRKGTQGYFRKTDIMRMKLYHCACEGHTDPKATVDKVPAYRKQHYRTDCKARLRVVREFDGPWKVCVFWEEHNHTLLEPDMSYLLRSSRNLSHDKRTILDTFNAAGIGVSSAYRYIEKDAGGRENVGFTRKDAYDHIRGVRKVSKVANSDADTLLTYFQGKSCSEPNFFWKVLLDDEGRIMNFYFRDGHSAQDYECFGDVVSLDTTFRTNKYNLICAPLVGLNHHRQTILFGIAFLSEETTESFQWLLQIFLESMEGKEPVIIFTDQDQALINAIDSTLRVANHRLCQWHINRNASSHFGKLNNNPGFRKLWFHCMNGCETETEFEETWNKMIANFSLEDNRWFSNMYGLRERWADVFTNDKFSSGLRATSRSEGTNKVIKDLCACSSSLSDFVMNYESIIRGWRTREREEDVACRGEPGQRVDGNCLLKHAARVYTRNVYELFEVEAMSSNNVRIINTMADSLGGDLSFTCTGDDEDRERIVTYNTLGNLVTCSCQLLVTNGMFCRHILKVFYTLNIVELPQQHILRRWTREAKERSRNSWSNSESTHSTRGADMVFLNRLMRMIYDFGVEVKSIEPIRDMTYDKIVVVIAEMKTKMKPCPEPVNNQKTKKDRPLGKDKCRDPPIPKHGWLPHKRRSTVLDKKNASKGKEKQKKITKSNTKRNDPLHACSNDMIQTMPTWDNFIDEEMILNSQTQENLFNNDLDENEEVPHTMSGMVLSLSPTCCVYFTMLSYCGEE